MAGKSRRWSTPARYPRTARVNEVLREVIASELERLQDDDARLELVTVTGIVTDPDLRRSTVYFSALGTKATLTQVLEALEEKRVALQAVVGRSVRLKRTPQLSFTPDPAIAEGQKVETILRGIQHAPDDE